MAKKNEQIEKLPVVNIISRVISVIFLIISIFFILRVSLLNIIPTRFLLLFYIIVVALNLFFLYLSFKRSSKSLALVIYSVTATIFSTAFVFASIKINQVDNFIKKNFDDNKKYSVYNIIVAKDSKVEKAEDLKGKNLYTYEEPFKEISNSVLRDQVKNVINDATLTFKEDLDEVMNFATSINNTASIVNNGTYESYASVNEGYADKIKIIGEIKIEIDETITTEEKNAITNDPFILYISGIDTRTGTMPTRSLSDVNIVAAVNPSTKKILLVSIPRDYYVLIHGDTGLKDKLTHAGSRGGVLLSRATIEDLLGINIERYIRVNFNFVTNLVDSIGGITVNNELNRTLKLNGCTYNPGDNYVDGKCALRFARERKSYDSGDRHRGENQEQVITRIVEKISKDKNLVMNYEKILDAVDGSFDSNVTSADISALIKMQLNDMSSWTVESYNLNGSGAMTKTHSYPNMNLYVMQPNMNTVNTAKAKIKEVLGE